MLKPALARGKLQVIGATTISEYRKYIEKDAALERRLVSTSAYVINKHMHYIICSYLILKHVFSLLIFAPHILCISSFTHAYYTATIID